MSITQSPLGATTSGQQFTVPVAGTTGWGAILTPAALAAADRASNVVTISGIGTGKAPFLRSGSGTSVIFGLMYDSAQTPTSVSFQVFGRNGASEPWTRLMTKAGSTTITITCDNTNDPITTTVGTLAQSYDVPVSAGTYRFSTPNMLNDPVDTQNCNEFIVGVVTALGGTFDTAYLLRKFI